MKQGITDTPTAVAGLTDETRYSLQNKSQNVIFLESASASPTDSSGAFVVEPFEWATIRKKSGQEVYLWAIPEIRPGRVVYDEAA